MLSWIFSGQVATFIKQKLIIHIYIYQKELYTEWMYFQKKIHFSFIVIVLCVSNSDAILQFTSRGTLYCWKGHIGVYKNMSWCYISALSVFWECLKGFFVCDKQPSVPKDFFSYFWGKTVKNETEGHGLIVKLKGSPHSSQRCKLGTGISSIKMGPRKTSSLLYNKVGINLTPLY